MSEVITSSAEFNAIWKAALKEFHANTSINLTNEDGLLHLQNIDELLDYLTKENAQYDEESGSSKFTSVVKNTLGPLKFLLGTGGKVAGDIFPGGSQVLSALSIFVEASLKSQKLLTCVILSHGFHQAGRAVTESFEAVAKLFTRIENFASRMRTVSEESIRPGLVPIYQTMLVSLLNICGLSIKITSRYLVAEGKTGKKSHRQNFLRKIRGPYANVAEYVKQLTGGNTEINDAVADLNDLVMFETSMMQASTLTEVMRIKTFTMNIQGLTIELGKTMSKSQSESTFRLSYIQQSQDRIEENTIDIKKAQSQTNAKLDSMAGTIAERVGRMMSSGTGRQQNEVRETKTSISKELKRWEKLAAALEVDGAKELNRAFYERIRQERVRGTTDWILEDTTVKRWIQGEIPFVVMSGATGNGKTFTASRVVEQLITSKASSGDPDKAVAYFFCRRGPYERSSVIVALRTMAYDIASSDQLFAKHLSDLIKYRKFQSNRAASKINLTASTVDSGSSIDAKDRSTAAKTRTS